MFCREHLNADVLVQVDVDLEYAQTYMQTRLGDKQTVAVGGRE